LEPFGKVDSFQKDYFPDETLYFFITYYKNHLQAFSDPYSALLRRSRTSDTSENPYVEKTLSYTIQLLKGFSESQLSQLDAQGLKITIFADNDFYSQKQTVRFSFLHQK
jgi:phosphomevalonate kinase